jgi:MoaA/NifB/PqqE/SkfB family radical SAM enzyme
MKSLYKGFFTFIGDYAFNRLSYTFQYPLIKPWRVNFDITHRCPLGCIMCNIWKEGINPKKELKLSELKNLVDQIHEWGVDHISFAGGETLVRAKDVVELIKHASRKHMRTDLITNGYFLDEKLCRELLKANVSKISLSVDGVKEKTHDYIRGRGNFDRVINAAKILKRLKEEMKNKVELEFTTVIMSHNFRELVDIFYLMRKMGFDFINYQAIVPDNTFTKNQETFYRFYKSGMWIEKRDIPELRRVVRKLVLLKKKTGKIRNTRKYLLLVPEYFEKKQNFRYGKCIVGYSYINIDSYGNINICGLGPNLNVRGNKLKNLWRSKDYNQTRTLIQKCRRPCLMLCYDRIDLKGLIQAWMELRGWT